MANEAGESKLFPGAHPAPPATDEAARITALHGLGLLDTLPEAAFDDIVQIASTVCGMPIALISLVDSERQWFKARVGLDAAETHRDLAFCAHAIRTPEQLFEVDDAAADPRFATNPLVTSAPNIRFYAGAPLVTPEGQAIGTLCVIDRVPRHLDPAQAEALRALGRRVMAEIELRRSLQRLADANAKRDEANLVAERRGTLLEAIIDTIPSAVVVVDTQARPMINNAAAQAVSGMASADFPADPRDWPAIYGICAPDGRVLEPAEVPLTRALGGERVSCEEVLIRNRRRPRGTMVEASARPVFDEQGRQLGALVIFTDIDERKRAEISLREAKRELEYFRQIAEGSSDFIALSKLDGRVRYINPVGRAMLGLDSIEAVQRTELLDYVFERDLTKATEEWLPTLMREGHLSVEIDMRHFKTGAVVPTQWRAFVLLDPDSGEPYAIAAHALFLAERLKIEAERETHRVALAESEVRFRAITEVAPQMIWTARPDGYVDYFNRFGLEYFGRPMEEVAGEGWAEHALHPDDLEPTMAKWQHALATGEPVEAQYRLRRHDGEYRWNIVRGVALLDGHGRPHRWHGVVTDIEELKRAQAASERANAALRRSETQYRFRSESIPLQVWTATPDGRLDYVNSFTGEYFGRPVESVIEDGWHELLHPDETEAAVARWRHSIETGLPYDIEFRLRRGDGQFRWNLARAVAQRDADGRIERWFGSTVEVEDIKQAQRLAEDATRAKSAFLSSMSHEIRTPMNAVIGMTSILLDSDLTADQRESAEVIRASGDHLLTVINDILDYSKIEAGKLELEHAAFGLRDCVESALDLVAASASVKGVELGYLMEAGTPESVLGDVGRLRQVLLNLLSNAVKFTPDRGEVMVELRAVPLAGDRLSIEVSVSDSGVGIAAEVLPQLFAPFTQADASTTRRFGGTGLGLSICRRLVEAMGGSIGVDSTPDRGSVFHFNFITEAAASAGRYSPPSASPQLAGLRVLIVDDIEINRRILIHYVGSWGMVAQATGSPREALQWLEGGAVFDLALFDYHMPEIDGLMLSVRVRPLASKLPIVILSSVALETRDAAIVSGALLKPIKPARLLETVARLMTPDSLRTTGSGNPEPLLPRELGHEHPLRLLVVEDNPVNQRVARLLLERMGYLADFAGNGLEALASVERQVYDALFMDVQMPVMDGYAATRELCRRYPPLLRPRIIGMTANATEEDRRNCLLAGMDDYLAKPVRPQELAAALRATVRRGTGSEADEDFSAEGLAELRRIYGNEGTVEIVGALVGDLDAQERELRRSLDPPDLPVLRRVAHTLKSNSRLVGASALGNHWDEFERHSHDNLTEAHGRLALALASRYGRLVRRLQRETGAGG